MDWIRRLLRRLRALGRLDAVERSMDDEMRAHLEYETAERVRGGAHPEAARRDALVAFGSVEAHKEAARDARGTRVAEDFVRDLRYAARALAHQRAFALSAMLTFALGIGAATAIFSVVYGVLLRPLPYDAPDRLVTLWERHDGRGVDRNVVSVSAFEAWRDQVTALEGVAAMVPAPVTLQGAAGPDRVVGAEVSPELFPLLGARPLLGRTFTDADARTGSVVVLSEALWRERFSGDPSIVGSRIHIDGRAHVGGAMHDVIGVMPAEFEPPAFGWMARRPGLWVPFVPSPDNRAYGRYLLIVGRLREGASLGMANAELRAVTADLAREMPTQEGWTAGMVPLVEIITGDVRSSLVFIFAAAALLLILAVTNVSLLLLARTRRRTPEFGLRRALGASDARVHRQLLAEALLLGAVGCAAGLAVATPLLDALIARLPPEIPRVSAIRLDMTVALVAAATTTVASILVGLVASRRGRAAASPLLRESSARSTAPARGGVLIAAEVAIGLVIAILAALMIRSFVTLRQVDFGFEASQTLAARVALGAAYDTPSRQIAFFDDLLERVSALEPVEQAGLISGRPIGGFGPRTSVRDARAVATTNDLIADIRWADAGFFRALRVPVIRGAVFDARDRPGPLPVVVNESLARALWPGETAVGRALALELNGGLEGTVIGVVGDIRLNDARTPGGPGLFLPPGRFGGEAYDLIVRTKGELATVTADLRAALASVDASLPLHRVMRFDDAVAGTMARDRFTATLLTWFAGLALLLAGVGIYGVCAAEMAHRRKEVGIRMALGAGAGRVLRGIVGTTVVSGAAGLAVGTLAAATLARSMESLLFGVDPLDAWSFGVSALVLLAVAVVATLLPAVQATRVSPLATLRE